MSTFSRQKKRRLRDFEKRWRLSTDVRTYRDWRYLTNHPFADETELLGRLSLRSEDCVVADVWWHTGKDVVLLQTWADSEHPSSVDVRWFGSEPYLSIFAKLANSTTTIENLHVLMDQISRRGLPKRTCPPRTLSF